MTTRFSGGAEEKVIQLQYAVGQAKTAIDELAERLETLRSLGKFSDEEHAQMMKALDSIRNAMK